jgi:hypothetical protein
VLDSAVEAEGNRGAKKVDRVYAELEEGWRRWSDNERMEVGLAERGGLHVRG